MVSVGNASCADSERAEVSHIPRCIASAMVAPLLVIGFAAPAAAAPKPEPPGTAFGKSCGLVTMIAVPGSTETTEGAGHDVVQGVLSEVMLKLQRAGGVRQHTVAYPAELGLPNVAKYLRSKKKGYQATFETMKYYAKQCPSTQFILLGYSQGAHVAGDLAATIGKESRPVKPNRLLSAHLLADPAKDPKHTPSVGRTKKDGIVTLAGLGTRGNFGKVDSRVTEYCTEADGVCNVNGHSLARLIETKVFKAGPHTEYTITTTPEVRDWSYTQTMKNKIVDQISNLNGAGF